MRDGRIIAIGDNVVDKFISRGKMYPGGQCVNTCVYATLNGARTSYLGKFGDDFAARYNCEVLARLGIDYSHSRHFHGENGAARVTVIDGDRVFLGSNKGGVAKEHPFDLTEEDMEFIRTFDVIYTNGNSYTREEFPTLFKTGIPIAYDFSDDWTEQEMEEIAPFVSIALLSTAHLEDEERRKLMLETAERGVRLVIGTAGFKGSYALYQGEFLYASARRAEVVMDTMGAGDAFFATLLTVLLQDEAPLFPKTMDDMRERLQNAMDQAAVFAAEVCATEGAFGFGTDIVD